MSTTWNQRHPGAVSTKRDLYTDQYAHVAFVESIPCIKLTLSGTPKSSEHYQFVHKKMLESVLSEVENYCRLHVLTDTSKAGVVLEEDVDFWQRNIIPEMEKAGVRYHAIVLPEGLMARLVLNQTSPATRKMQIGYFNTLSGASKWLKNR